MGYPRYGKFILGFGLKLLEIGGFHGSLDALYFLTLNGNGAAFCSLYLFKRSVNQ
jgi:hypothetical protein